MNKYMLCALLTVNSLSLRGMAEKGGETLQRSLYSQIIAEQNTCRGVYEEIKRDGRYSRLKWSSLFKLWNGAQGVKLTATKEECDCFFSKLTYCLKIEEVEPVLEKCNSFESFWTAVLISKQPKFANRRNEIFAEIMDLHKKEKGKKAISSVKDEE